MSSIVSVTSVVVALAVLSLLLVLLLLLLILLGWTSVVGVHAVAAVPSNQASASTSILTLNIILSGVIGAGLEWVSCGSGTESESLLRQKVGPS